MRRTLIATVLLAVLALLGPASSAQSADEGKGQTATLNITKVVDGDGPTGGFVIDYVCIAVDRSREGGSSGSLSFDAAGPGAPETQTVEIDDAATCTVTETDENGAASVSYTCAFDANEGPASPDPFAGEGTEGLAGCVDDQSALFTSPGQVADITVTNTFEADVLPDDDEPPAVDPDVVSATPPFTG